MQCKGKSGSTACLTPCFSPSKLHKKSHIPFLRVLKNVFPLPFVSLLYGSRDNGILSVGLSIDCRSPELPESCRWAQPRKWSFPALILTIFTPQHGHFYPSMWSHGFVSAITNVRCRQVSDIGNAAEDVNIMEKNEDGSLAYNGLFATFAKYTSDTPIYM